MGKIVMLQFQRMFEGSVGSEWMEFMGGQMEVK